MWIKSLVFHFLFCFFDRSEFGLFLAYFYLCDRTDFFASSKKVDDFIRLSFEFRLLLRTILWLESQFSKQISLHIGMAFLALTKPLPSYCFDKITTFVIGNSVQQANIHMARQITEENKIWSLYFCYMKIDIISWKVKSSRIRSAR